MIGIEMFAVHAGAAGGAIDRQALVTRHNVILEKAERLSPLSVGNGGFVFTADITGLQTFPEFHEPGVPLHTMASWGWHTFPNPERYAMDDVFTAYDAHGRRVPYLDGQGKAAIPNDPDRAGKANAWLRANPHRIDLARVGLVLRHADGQSVGLNDLAAPCQTLDLWQGLLQSRFELCGQPVRVLTVCHPDRDALAVRIESPLLASQQIQVRIAFPYATGDWRDAADWVSPERHRTKASLGDHRGDFERVLDANDYRCAVAYSPAATMRMQSEHDWLLSVQGQSVLEVVAAFSPERVGHGVPGFEETREAAVRHWRQFWLTGGAIDLSTSADPRARELERRIVLSQYLTAINCAASIPPSETGLVMDSWHGKAHLEMHWWHAAHFALWGRAGLLEKSLPWYDRILPLARTTARRQGYDGARWPKMVGPDGRESPSSVGVFLIWQQPHPIFFAELLYRARPSHGTLDRYRTLVKETARFMASYPAWDAARERFVLGPPLIPAQESYGRYRERVINPTFELAYWHWGLETAQQWRSRLGLAPDPQSDHVLKHLAKPTVRDGVYEAIEVEPYTLRNDHPSLVGALGLLPPTPLVDSATMKRTLAQVLQSWKWESTWGWDYPLLAMTAARLNSPGQAIDALLLDTPKNRYLASGHNYQTPRLPLYLPGNGGLLYAAAMMAAGWDGGPDRAAPGFPADGAWSVKWEGLRKAP